LFPNIWILPPFQRNYYQSAYCDFVLSRDMTMYLVLSAFGKSKGSLNYRVSSHCSFVCETVTLFGFADWSRSMQPAS
jgi:hypothetical protein